MAITEQVDIVLNAKTGRYETQIKSATRATDKLGDSIDDVEEASTLGAESITDLGTAAKQTGEAAVDSATGFSGLGAALSSVATRVRAAAAGLSTFTKALIATGVGAALVALGVIVTHWEDISKAIGLSKENLDDFNEATEEQIKLADIRLKIAQNLGETEEQQLQIQLESAIELAGLAEDEVGKLARARERVTRRLTGLFVDQEREIIGINAALVQEGFEIETIASNFAVASSEVTRLNRELDELRSPPADPAEDDLSALGIPTDEQIEQAGASEQQLRDQAFEIFKRANEATKEEADSFRVDEFAAEEEQVEDLSELYAKQLADRKKQNDEFNAAKKIADKAVADAEVDVADGVFDALSVIAGESLLLQGAIGIAEVIVSTSRAIAGVTASLAAVPFGLAALPAAIAAIKLNGVKQAAIIAAVTGAKAIAAGQGGVDITTETPTNQRDQFNQSAFSREGGERRFDSQVVLVTEDLNTVQNRVRVTEDRASI